MADLHEISDEELLTAYLWAEARGEPEDGQQTVCSVMLNRVKKKVAPSIRDVILKPNQFSWTNPNDVNFEKVFTAKTDGPESWGQSRAGRVRNACKDRVPGVPKRGRRRTAMRQTPGKL